VPLVMRPFFMGLRTIVPLATVLRAILPLTIVPLATVPRTILPLTMLPHSGADHHAGNPHPRFSRSKALSSSSGEQAAVPILPTTTPAAALASTAAS